MVLLTSSQPSSPRRPVGRLAPIPLPSRSRTTAMVAHAQEEMQMEVQMLRQEVHVSLLLPPLALTPLIAVRPPSRAL